MTRRASLIVAVLIASVVMAAPVPKAIKKQDDAKLLEGRWEIVTVDGGRGPEAQSGDNATRYLVVTDGRLSTGLASVKGYVNLAVKLDPEQSPKRIDIEETPGRFLPCIYALDGDTLTWCHAQGGQPRPTEFKGGGPGGQYCLVYKRVKE